MTTIEQLFKTLSERKRPEDVAELVMELTKGTVTNKESNYFRKGSQRFNSEKYLWLHFYATNFC